MNARAVLSVVMLAGAAAAGCGKATAREGERLPGRTRPVLEHDWRHPRELQFSASAFRAPDPRAALVTTPSGVRAYVIEGNDDRVVQISAALRLGRGTEGRDETGAAELISRTLQRDVSTRLGRAFPARVQVDQDIDVTRISVHVLPEHWQPALAAVATVLREPRVDEAAIAAYRTGPGFARQSRGLGGPGFRPAVELARMSGGYPIAPPDPGRTLSRYAVTALTARSLRAQGVVFGIGGRVARADVERALRQVTAGWPSAAGVEAAAVSGPGDPADQRFNAIDEPGYTTWIAVGHSMPRIRPEQEAAVAVLTEILNIRLNIAVREIRGLANQAVLHVTATTSQPGLLHVRTGGRPESVAPLIKLATEELSRSRGRDGLASPDELEQATGGLVFSQWQRSLDGAGAASATYAAETVRRGDLTRLFGWPDAVRAVTAEHVRAAAEHYIQPQQMRIVIVGQLDAVRRARHPRWPVSLDEVRRGQ
jgi:predicted Zn-dependent peptidase